MRNTIYLLPACLLLAAGGCRRNHEGPAPVRIAPMIETRVSALHFDAGDRIGLTIARASGVYADNVMMTYDGSTFAADLFWYATDEQATLKAYYPFSEAGIPTTFRVAADQRGGITASDLLAAYKSGVAPGSAPVGMVFKHLMSQVSFVVRNATASPVTQVTVRGLATNAAVDFETLTATATGTASDVVACEVTSGTLYRAVLVPQTADMTVEVLTADGKTHNKTLKAAQIEGGWRYDVQVDVTEAAIEATIGGEITDWQDGGTLTGNDPGGNGNDHVEPGDGQTLVYGGETYATVAIGGKVWMAENLRYIPAAASIGSGIWYPCEGTAAGEDPAYVRAHGLLYDYATATGGGAATKGAVLRGICPEGWHLPDADELSLLTDPAATGSGFLVSGGIWNAGTGKYGSVSKGYLMSVSSVSAEQCSCLLFLASGAQPSVVPFLKANGVSVRCVKD